MRCEICQAQKDKIIKSQLDVDPTKDSLIVANSKRVVTGSRGGWVVGWGAIGQFSYAGRTTPRRLAWHGVHSQWHCEVQLNIF